MKRIHLTRNRIALVDDEDYESVSRFKWTLLPKGYASCIMFMGNLNHKRVLCTMKLHRLIMRPPDSMEIDHINHNGLDCRRSNMRICTHQQNQYNQISRYGASQYKGVIRERRPHKCWRARIKHNNKLISLGFFYNETEAAIAYNQKAKELFGEFANLNII